MAGFQNQWRNSLGPAAVKRGTQSSLALTSRVKTQTVGMSFLQEESILRNSGSNMRQRKFDTKGALPVEWLIRIEIIMRHVNSTIRIPGTVWFVRFALKSD